MESELQLHELADILRRRLRLILTTAIAGTALTGAGALLIPPSYTAKAQIIFEPQYVWRPGEPAPVVSPAAEDAAIATQVTTLVSFAHTERVRGGLADDPDYAAASKAEAVRAAAAGTVGDTAWRAADGAWRRLGPWLPAFLLPAAQPVVSAQPAVSVLRQATFPAPSQQDFQRHLRAFQEAGSHVIAVTYTASSPQVAAVVANRTIQSYIDDQNDQKRAATTRELAWLGQRIPAIKAEVDRVAAETQRYQAAHGLAQVNEAATLDQVAELTRQAGTAEAELAARQARLGYVRGLRSGGSQSGGSSAAASLDYLGSPLMAELHRQELVQLQAQAELSTTFVGTNPRLLQVRGRLGELRQKIGQEADYAIRNLDNEAQIAAASLATLRRRLATLQQAGANGQLRDLRHDAAVQEQLYTGFVQRQEELRGQQNMLRPDVSVLSRAAAPERPSSPSPLLFVLPGMLVFVMGGSMMAVLADRLDRRMRSRHDVMQALDVPCLALVPTLRRIGRMRPHQSLVRQPLGAYTEAIRSVVASLRLTAPEGAPKVILISSSVPGEGKTTLAVSLATYVASPGRRVLLIDLDFRHSSVGRELGGKAAAAATATGVLDLLQHDRSPAEVIQHLPDLRLDYLPMTRRPTDPFAPFASNQMRQLLGELRASYDCVIVDGPPAAGDHRGAAAGVHGRQGRPGRQMGQHAARHGAGSLEPAAQRLVPRRRVA